VRLPRIKRAHSPTRLPTNRIRIGSVQYGVGAEIEDSEEGEIWALLRLMDGTRTPAMIVDQLLAERPDLDRESVVDAAETLFSSGYIEDAAAEVDPRLQGDEIERYRRNENYFSWVDTTPRTHKFELQGRLKASSIAVLGLGGSGSSVAVSLVAAGVGHIRCVDFDVVEVSNLSRQLLYTEGDVGRSKVRTAVAHLRRLNHHVRVEGVESRIGSVTDAVRCLDDVDFAVLCADKPNPEIQYWINDAAIATKTPWSICLYAGPMLASGIFVPDVTPCYRCLLATAPMAVASDTTPIDVASHDEDEENSVIAPSAALTGHFGALEAIYFLTGLEPQTVGRVFHLNLLAYDHQYYVEAEFSPDCASCGGLPRTLAEPAGQRATA
jgi:molybdopterin-synthase adenylyltransferase